MFHIEIKTQCTKIHVCIQHFSSGSNSELRPFWPNIVFFLCCHCNIMICIHLIYFFSQVPAAIFLLPPTIKDKVGDSDEAGRSLAPPVDDQQHVAQPVKPPSPPPRPQLLYSNEVGTVHTTPSGHRNCGVMKTVV